MDRLLRLLLDPSPTDGGGGAAPAPAQSPPSNEPASFRPEPEPSPAPAPAPASPAAPETPAPVVPSGIRDAARQFGVDLSQLPDDNAALAYLLQQRQRAEQSDYYARLGQALVPHATQFQQFLQQQQQPAQPQARPAYEPPPFDQRFLALVEEDPQTGMYMAKPGVPADIARQVNEYAEWRRNFLSNPTAILTPLVESRAQQIARQQVQEALAQRDQETAVQQVIQANASWMYDANPNPFGQPQLSALGQRYQQHVQTLARAGVTDIRLQDQLAQQLLRGQLAAAQQQPQPSPAPASPGLPAPGGNVNPLQALDGALRTQTPGATEPSTQGLNLKEMLQEELRKSGVADNDFATIR